MLKHDFGPTTEFITLFSLSKLRAKSKDRLNCVRDFLFEDDTHSSEDLQHLMNRFNEALRDRQERKLNVFHMRCI